TVALDSHLRAVPLEDGAELLGGLLDAFHLDAGMNVDADARTLFAHLLDGVRIKRGQKPRQDLEDGDLGARAGIDVAELESDHPAADEKHAFRQLPLAQ